MNKYIDKNKKRYTEIMMVWPEEKHSRWVSTYVNCRVDVTFCCFERAFFFFSHGMEGSKRNMCACE